jgi:hypothetical protein
MSKRFTVYTGGGIGELHNVRHGLTFKQAVQAWVRGQKRCPTDCEIALEVDDNVGWAEAERLTQEAVSQGVRDHRRWVELQMMQQSVYNLRALEFRNPFSRG